MIAMVDPAGNSWTWSFDVLGHQVSATDPDTGITTSTYDNVGNLPGFWSSRRGSRPRLRQAPPACGRIGWRVRDSATLPFKCRRILGHDCYSESLISINNYEVKVVKLQGEFVWHTHPDTDELFMVVRASSRFSSAIATSFCVRTMCSWGRRASSIVQGLRAKCTLSCSSPRAPSIPEMPAVK